MLLGFLFSLLSNKPLYFQNAILGNIANYLTSASREINDIDLIVAIEDELDDEKLSSYCWNSFSSALIIITNKTNDIKIDNHCKNIRIV